MMVHETGAGQQSRENRAFTRTELVIIIAIVAILAAILVPVFTQAREKSHSNACLSNERQIGVALLNYSQDYDDTLPFYFYASDSSGNPSTAPGNAVVRYKWMDAIYPFVKKEEVFNCPSDIFPWKAQDGSGQINNGYHFRHGTDYGSYLMNATYRYDSGPRTPPSGRWGEGLKRSKVVAPATTIWIVDGGLEPGTGKMGANFGWSCLNSSIASKPCTKQPDPLINTKVSPPQLDRLVARHQEMANVIYCDGHAKAITLDSIAKPKASGGSMATDGTVTALTIEND